jgi:hypothetical protein
LGGHADVYTVTLEELASHGYIVVAATHNDLSAAYNEFPDGRILPYRPPPPEEDLAANIEFRNGQLKNRVTEMRWLIDQLHVSNQVDIWGPIVANRFDTTRIGMMGHSFGATTTICTASADRRIKCAVTQDVWLVPCHKEVVTNGLPDIPVMVFLSNAWVNWAPHMPYLKGFVSKSTNPGTVFLGLKDTRHSNFDDVSLFSPLISKKLGATGTLPIRRAYSVIGRYHTAFFAKHLRGPKDGDTREEPAIDEVLDCNRCKKHWPEMMWLSSVLDPASEKECQDSLNKRNF